MAKIHMTANGTTPVCNRPGKTELTTTLSAVTCDRCPQVPTIDLVIALWTWGTPAAIRVIQETDASVLLSQSESLIQQRKSELDKAQMRHSQLQSVLTNAKSLL
jgi:hypothetical protein